MAVVDRRSADLDVVAVADKLAADWDIVYMVAAVGTVVVGKFADYY